jgi:hypothetical protein
MTTAAAKLSKSWRWPAFAIVMIGEALMIQISPGTGFRDDFVGPVLERRDIETLQGIDELAPGQSRDLSGSPL